MSFKDSLKKKLEETVGYGISFDNQLPIQMVDFPQPQNQQLVTTGETKPLGEPREDKAMEQGTNQDPAVIDEIGNLLLTIGYILNSSGLISDRFNTVEILDFINHNFQQPEYPTEQNSHLSPSTNCACNGEHSCGDNCSCVSTPPGYNYFQESRKLFESRHSK